MERILFLFMMFSIVGWLWETPWVSIRTKKYVNRGFLHGPYIPIYGFAVVTIILTMSIFDGVDHSNIVFILLEMIYMGVVTALWEFFTSYGLEKIFHTRWWDYSSHKYNIQGRISLYVTVFFGVGGYILWRFVLPVFDNLYDIIPTMGMTIILIVFYIIFTVDSVATVRDLFKVRNVMATIEKLSKELSDKVDVKLQEYKVSYKDGLTKLDNNIIEVKNKLSQIYKDIEDTKLSKRVQAELNKIQESYTKNRNILRFYRKYPNSTSVEMMGIKKWLDKLPGMSKKVEK